MPSMRRLWAAVAALLLTVLPAAAQKRVALVIGNSAYAYSTPLTNPANDAADMAAALKAAGFTTIIGLDTDKRGFDMKVREFARALEQADDGVLFYAGHGVQVGGQNFLVPVDAKLESERDLDFETVRLDFILRQMELGRENKTNLVFLDACRDNPLSRNLARSMGTRSAAVGRGLAQVQTGVGTFISYSTQPGNVALDGSGRNSPFTTALVKHVNEPGRSLNAVMIDVRKDVLAATAGKQVPWDHSALTGDFYFMLASAPQMAPKSPRDAKGVADMEARIRELEGRLSRQMSPEDAEKIARLIQLKERLRQLEQGVRGDREMIFELSRNLAKETTPEGRLSVQQRIGRAQVLQVQRSRERKEVADWIAKLEEETAAVRAKQ
ncbi:MAG: caspase domain-containing protein [Hyphomicrobiaceae bacterium]